jgi:protein-tyrosine phosphatase
MYLVAVPICFLLVLLIFGSPKSKPKKYPPTIEEQTKTWKEAREAVMLQDVERLEELVLNLGSCINYMDQCRMTLLHYAASRANANIVRVILRHPEVRPAVVGSAMHSTPINLARQYRRMANIGAFLEKSNSTPFVIPFNCDDSEFQHLLAFPHLIPKQNEILPIDYLYNELELKWEKVISQVDEMVFISGKFGATHIPSLILRGITSVINMCAEFETHKELEDTEIHQRRFPLYDDKRENLEVQLEGVLVHLFKELQNGNKVLVNCRMGYSRSGSIIVVYLMLTQHLSFKDALSMARQYRPVINPNEGFVKQIEEFSKKAEFLDLRDLYVLNKK